MKQQLLAQRPEVCLADEDALTELLAGLYERQIALESNEYLVQHAQPGVIRRQVQVFQWYAPYLPTNGVVLDWGCAHGPDSCMLRAVFGDHFQRHGCDFVEDSRY